MVERATRRQIAGTTPKIKTKSNQTRKMKTAADETAADETRTNEIAVNNKVEPRQITEKGAAHD